MELTRTSITSNFSFSLIMSQSKEAKQLYFPLQMQEGSFRVGVK